jgi:glycosyltransferase involved in cell wall biosynthesis
MTADSATIAFLVNGNEDSAAGHRARAFAERLGPPWRAVAAYRAASRLHDAWRFRRFLRSVAPDIVYVMDLAVAGVCGSLLPKPDRTKVVVDTGDAVYELARSAGDRGFASLHLTRAVEELALRQADALVVRGTEHQQLLARRGITATVVQDGVHVDDFAHVSADNVRDELGLGNALVVGVLGSVIWNPRLQLAYGWDLVELLRILDDPDIKGLLIGDGSGIPYLKERARRYGVYNRIVFAGRLPYETLPRVLKAVDIGLSTQTNDIAGRVRTTGKLPLYLASGCCVLASRVGEATRVLPDSMLVDYEGTVDREYPKRLAERIGRLRNDGAALRDRNARTEIARRHFEYDELVKRVEVILAGAIS